MSTTHNMKTRSKNNDNDNNDDDDNDTDNDTDNDNDNESPESLQSNTNLTPEQLQILKRKRNNNINKSIKKSKSIPTLPDLLVEYIIKKANDKIQNKKINKIIETDEEDILLSDSDSESVVSGNSDSEFEIYKLDKYDEKFELLNNKNNADDIDINYFSKLNKNKKIYILSQLEKINNIHDRNTPLKFKILE